MSRFRFRNLPRFVAGALGDMWYRATNGNLTPVAGTKTTGHVPTIQGDGSVAWAAGSGGGAPTTAQYVTLATDATLTNERVLTAGTGITITDGGAGNPVTIAATGGGGGSGKVAQVVNTQTGAVATGTTVIPFDNTIPQNTEGDQYMSLSITPTNASSKLKIDVVFWGTNANINHWLSVALFQDSTANALAAFANFQTVGTAANASTFTHYMTAGTTSATTFKVRAGPNTADTVTFNGQSGGRIFGGVMASSITITEILP